MGSILVIGLSPLDGYLVCRASDNICSVICLTAERLESMWVERSWRVSGTCLRIRCLRMEACSS